MIKTLLAKLARSAALAALLLVGATGATLAQDEGPWTVVVATNATVVHATGTAPLAAGEVVAPGDRITTDAGGAAVLARGDDLITMSEDSVLTITSVQPVGGTLIEQQQGLVKYQVTKQPNPHFTVETEVLATIVKGTTFTVRATADSSAVAVAEGKVEARDNRVPGAAAVYPGQVATVSVTGTPGVSVKAGTITGAVTTVPGTGITPDAAINETPGSDTETAGKPTDTQAPGATDTVTDPVSKTVDVVGDTVTKATNAVSDTVVKTTDVVSDTVNKTTNVVGDTINGLTGNLAGGSGSSGSGSGGSGSSGSGSGGSGSSGSGSSGSGSSGSGSSGSGSSGSGSSGSGSSGSGSSGSGSSGSGSSGSGSGGSGSGSGGGGFGGLGGLGGKLGGGLGGLL